MQNTAARLTATQTSPFTIPRPRPVHTRDLCTKTLRQLTVTRDPRRTHEANSAQAPILATQVGGHRLPRCSRKQALEQTNLTSSTVTPLAILINTVAAHDTGDCIFATGGRQDQRTAPTFVVLVYPNSSRNQLRVVEMSATSTPPSSKEKATSGHE